MADHVSWLMQEDPDLYTRKDGVRERVANTGFWIIKNDDISKGMLRDLIMCPLEVCSISILEILPTHE